MTPLPSTTTLPTVPGWYVYQPTPPSVAVVVLVEHTGTGWRAYHAGCSLPVPVHAMPGTWCGPLALDALVEAVCALCAEMAGQPDENCSAFVERIYGFNTWRTCQCGVVLHAHAAQHPHGCASSGCVGWQARKEER